MHNNSHLSRIYHPPPSARSTFRRIGSDLLCNSTHNTSRRLSLYLPPPLLHVFPYILCASLRTTPGLQVTAEVTRVIFRYYANGRLIPLIPMVLLCDRLGLRFRLWRQTTALLRERIKICTGTLSVRWQAVTRVISYLRLISKEKK